MDKNKFTIYVITLVSVAPFRGEELVLTPYANVLKRLAIFITWPLYVNYIDNGSMLYHTFYLIFGTVEVRSRIVEPNLYSSMAPKEPEYPSCKKLVLDEYDCFFRNYARKGKSSNHRTHRM